MKRFIVAFFLGVVCVNVFTSKAQADDTSLFPLIEGYWQLVYLKDVELKKDNLHLDIFNGTNTKSVFGNLGFNSFTGHVDIKPKEKESVVFEELNEIVFSIRMTKMAAIESDLMDFEKNYFEAINTVREYGIFNGDLIFFNEFEEQVIRYSRHKQGAPKRLIVNSISSRVYENENINMGGENGYGTKERISIESVEDEDSSFNSEEQQHIERE